MDSGSSGKAGGVVDARRGDRDPLLPPPPRTMGKGLALAILVHVLLVAGLALSVNWKSSDPPAVEAELYSSIPRAAAPRAQDVTPPPTDPTPPAPTPPPPAPAPAPTPPPPPPPPVRATPAPPPEVDPQIAIEQDKRKREQALRDQQDKQEQQQKLAKAKADKDRAAKLEAARAQDLKDEQDRKDKLAADQREKALEQQKADKLAQQKAQQAQQLAQQAAQQKAAKEAQLKEQREAQTLAAQREANLKRIMGQAGATGAENATGTAQRSSGPSSSYGGRVAARVKPNIVFGDDVPGNPSAEVSVTIGPDGTITGSRITKPSGVKAWDDAVLRAVERTATLPRDTDGRVPPSLVIAFRPHDL